MKVEIQKVFSVTVNGIVKPYPQKFIKTKPIRIINKRIYYKSSKELLDKVNKTKLLVNYKKRMRNLHYKSEVEKLRLIENYFDKWLNNLENISSEDGNSNTIIWNRELKLKNINNEVNR